LFGEGLGNRGSEDDMGSVAVALGAETAGVPAAVRVRKAVILEVL